MRKEYDFSKGKRGAVIPSTGKTRITIMLDAGLLSFLRAKAEAAGAGYQTLINSELKAVAARLAGKDTEPLAVERLRQERRG